MRKLILTFSYFSGVQNLTSQRIPSYLFTFSSIVLLSCSIQYFPILFHGHDMLKRTFLNCLTLAHCHFLYVHLSLFLSHTYIQILGRINTGIFIQVKDLKQFYCYFSYLVLISFHPFSPYKMFCYKTDKKLKLVKIHLRKKLCNVTTYIFSDRPLLLFLYPTLARSKTTNQPFPTLETLVTEKVTARLTNGEGHQCHGACHVNSILLIIFKCKG